MALWVVGWARLSICGRMSCRGWLWVSGVTRSTLVADCIRFESFTDSDPHSRLEANEHLIVEIHRIHQVQLHLPSNLQ